MFPCLSSRHHVDYQPVATREQSRDTDSGQKTLVIDVPTRTVTFAALHVLLVTAAAAAMLVLFHSIANWLPCFAALPSLYTPLDDITQNDEPQPWIVVVPFYGCEEVSSVLARWEVLPPCSSSSPVADLMFATSVYPTALACASALVRALPKSSAVMRCVMCGNSTTASLVTPTVRTGASQG